MRPLPQGLPERGRPCLYDSNKHGLYEQPVLSYAKALAATARKAEKTPGARWVCRDHLTVIGDARSCL